MGDLRAYVSSGLNQNTGDESFGVGEMVLQYSWVALEGAPTEPEQPVEPAQPAEPVRVLVEPVPEANPAVFEVDVLDWDYNCEATLRSECGGKSYIGGPDQCAKDSVFKKTWGADEFY